MTKYEYGDLTHVCPEGQPFTDLFSVEMRSRARLEVLGVVYRTDPKYSLLSWWAKAVRDAELSDRVPLLVTHTTRGVDMVWAPTEMYSNLCTRVNTLKPAVSFKCNSSPVQVDPGKNGSSYTLVNHVDVLGVLLEDWFRLLCPGEVMKCARWLLGLA